MKGSGHTAKPLIRIHQDNLRCRKFLPRIQFPLKIIGMNPHGHPHRIKLGQLCLCQEIAGIHKVHSIHFARLLGRPRCQKRQKRVFLMAGFPSYRGHHLPAMSQGSPLHLPFSCPGAVKRQHFKSPVIHIQTGTIGFFQINRFFSHILKSYTSCHHIGIRKNTIGEKHFQLQHLIRHSDFQGLAGIRCPKGCREPGKSRFTRLYFMRFIDKLTSSVSLRIPHLHAALSVVSHTTEGILHRKGIQKRTLLPLILRGNVRRLFRPQQIRSVQAFNLLSKMNMP